VDSGSWVDGTGTSFNLSSGAHTYAVHQTDYAGNTSVDSVGKGYTLDTTAPTLSSITDNAASTATGDVTFSFAFSEAVSGFSAADVNITGGTKGTFTQVDTSHYTLAVTPPQGTGSFTASVTAGSYTDLAGNANTVAGPTDTQAYNKPVSLGAGNGQLINGINVDGGMYYYHWDVNGNGVADAGDLVSMDTLEMMFFGQSAGTFMSDTNRHMVLNGLDILLVARGDNYNATTNRQGTAVSGTASNGTFNDMLAIWDAYNGTDLFNNTNGVPPGWGNTYWTSSFILPTGGGHIGFNLSTGSMVSYNDAQPLYVAFQVSPSQIL
jgi:hypothetical protein